MPLSEILGYVGMAFVGVSFFFANIRILRLLNLIGATAMTVYGFMIDQPPVAILNIIIVGVNVYYLSKTSALISRFDVLSVQYQRNDAFDRFYHAHEEDIKVFFPNCSPAVLETAKIEVDPERFSDRWGLCLSGVCGSNGRTPRLRRTQCPGHAELYLLLHRQDS